MKIFCVYTSMNDQKVFFSDKERIEKNQALKALAPVKAMSLEQVPAFFLIKGNRDKEVLKKQIGWAYYSIHNTTPESPIGKVSITKGGIRDSLFKGTNRYKASLYPILDKLIEKSIFLFDNTDFYGERQFVLGGKFSRCGEEEYVEYVGIVIRIDSRGNKYYSHTIYQKNNRKAQGVPDNQGLTQKLHPAVYNILHEILSVNSKPEGQP
jgi:hypothetical protein